MEINVSETIMMSLTALLGFLCHVTMKAEEGKRKHKGVFTLREFANRNYVGWLASIPSTALVMIISADTGMLNYMTAAMAGYTGNSILQKLMTRAEKNVTKE